MACSAPRNYFKFKGRAWTQESKIAELIRKNCAMTWQILKKIISKLIGYIFRGKLMPLRPFLATSNSK